MEEPGSRVGILKTRLDILPTFARVTCSNVTRHRSKKLRKRMKFHSSLKVNCTEGKSVFIDLTESWQSFASPVETCQDDLVSLTFPLGIC